MVAGNGSQQYIKTAEGVRARATPAGPPPGQWRRGFRGPGWPPGVRVMGQAAEAGNIRDVIGIWPDLAGNVRK